MRSTLKADDVGRQVMQKGVVFLQNTLRPARDLKGKTKKQIASARITESLVGTRGTYEYVPSLIRWSFSGVSIEFQTGIDKEKPNTKRRGRNERTTETTKSTKVEVGQGASVLERVYLDSL